MVIIRDLFNLIYNYQISTDQNKFKEPKFLADISCVRLWTPDLISLPKHFIYAIPFMYLCNANIGQLSYTVCIVSIKIENLNI